MLAARPGPIRGYSWAHKVNSEMFKYAANLPIYVHTTFPM